MKLLERAWPDLFFVIFLAVDTLVGLIGDFEIMLIPEVAKYTPEKYPYPPKFAVDGYHWWGRTADPLVFQRPFWFRAMIAVRAALLPLQVAMIFGFVGGKSWVRLPGIMWSTAILYSMVIILAEVFVGTQYNTPNPMAFLAAYLPYVVVPAMIIFRLWRPKPFESELGVRPHKRSD
mmetsp:Transcript_28285/g.45814  ORF Transcript_28285/g.45814 Transcript_28285/m.45814 type:complete len:176 (-) Transcript_28285:444-971(-)